MRLISICSFALAACASHNGRLLTLDQLVERNAEAMGGRARLEALNSVVTLRTPTSLFSLKRPHYVLVEGFDSAGHVTYSEGFNGREAWEQTRTDSVRRVVSGRPVIALRRVAQWPGTLMPLYRLKAYGHVLTLEHEQEIGGVRYYRLLLTLDDGFRRRYFVNATTFRIERARDVRELHANDGVTREIETRFLDYREVDGYWFPFTVTEHDVHTGERLSGRTVLGVFPNAELPDSLFDPSSRADFRRVLDYRARSTSGRK